MTSPNFQPSQAAKVLVYDAAGAFSTLLPTYTALDLQEALNDTGSFTLTLPRSTPGLDTALALDSGSLGMEIDGVELLRFLLEDDTDDTSAVEDPHREVSISGRGSLAFLEEAIVMNPDPSVSARPFTAQSIGKIMGTLILEAKNRGCFPFLQTSFTDLTDSSGANWTNNITVALDNGQDLLKTVLQLVEQGWVDARMSGLTLNLYNPNSATGLARDMPGIIVRQKASGISSPRKKSRRGIATDITVVGDQYVQVTRSNPNARTRYRRRESFVAAGGYTDTGQLTLIGDNTLTRLSRAQEGIEFQYDVTAPAAPYPWQDYRVGDWIKRDDSVGDVAGMTGYNVSTESYRVRGITASYADDGSRQVTLELNDLFLEQDVIVARTLDALTNSSSFVSTPNPTPGTDTTTPSDVGAVGLTAQAYQGSDGRTYAGYTATWQNITTNTDGSPIYDFNSYHVSWQVGSQQWTTETLVTAGTTAYFSGVLPGVTVQVRVKGYDNNGHGSNNFAYSNVLVAPGDVSAPGVPSTPVVDPMIGGLRVIWDGLDNQGFAMPADFAKLEVHASTSTNFTPQASTLKDVLYTAGTAPLVDLPYGSTWYVRFVAVDFSNNRTAPSAQGSGLSGQVATGDVADGAITDVKIGSLSASKITTGLLSADMTLTGRLKTALTGQRWEQDSLGFRLYDANGTITAQLATNGISLSGGIVAGGRIEGSQFLTAKLADLAAVNYDADYASLDTNGGLSVFRESTINLVVNPCGDPGDDISNLTWTVNTSPQPAYWTPTLGSGTTMASTKPGFDRIFGDAGYDLPWQISVTRAANTLNRIASNMAAITPQTLYTVSGWTYLSGIAATPYLRVYWYAASSDPLNSYVSFTDLPRASSSQNGYRRYIQPVTSPTNGNFMRIEWRDNTSDPAGRWHFTGMQFEVGDHATTFTDALSQPGCYPSDGSANYLFCYSKRNAGIAARIGARGQVDKLAGPLVAGSFRTAEKGRRLIIETTRGSAAAIGRIQWYEEGQSNPAVIGVDRSGNDYPTNTGNLITQMYALTPVESGRYGKMMIGPAQSQFGIVNSDGSASSLLVFAHSGHSATFYGTGSIGSGSARATKTDIVYTADAPESHLTQVRKLRPARYRMKGDPDNPRHVGLIAEDVHEVYPELVGYRDGKPDSVSLYDLSSVTLAALQELADKVDRLERKVPRRYG